MVITQKFLLLQNMRLRASPASSDVVGFVNVDRNNAQSDNFKIPTELADRIGIQANRTYNVKNVSAYTAQQVNRRDIWLWQDVYIGCKSYYFRFLL